MVYQQRKKHGPLSARDSASRYFDVASVKETKAGNANKHNCLYVDLTDPRVKDPLTKTRHEYFYYRGIRYLEEPIEYNICFHCSNGGVRIDENAESVTYLDFMLPAKLPRECMEQIGWQAICLAPHKSLVQL